MDDPERAFQPSQWQSASGNDANQYHKQMLEICRTAINSMRDFFIKEDARKFGKHTLDRMIKDLIYIHEKLDTIKKDQFDSASRIVDCIWKTRGHISVASDMLLEREDNYSQDARSSFYDSIHKCYQSLEEASEECEQVLEILSNSDGDAPNAS